MQLDNTDYKIILDALYNLAVSDSADLSDDVLALEMMSLNSDCSSCVSILAD